MTNLFFKLENIKHNTILIYITIFVIFVLDLVTPLGSVVWILYIIPILMNPYKTLKRSGIYINAAIITALLWVCFFSDTAGIVPKIAFSNRIIMSFILWVITYVQMQRANTHQELIKQMEMIKKSEERFRVIEEGFAHYQALYDENGRVNDILVLEINPSGAETSGVSRENQLGKRWKEVWEGIEDDLFDVYDQVDKTGISKRFEFFSGITEKWYLNNISRIAPGHFAVTFFDITERKSAELALKESEARLIDTQKLAHVGSFDLDILTGKIQWTEETYHIYEVDPNSAVPDIQDITSMFHPDDRQWIAEKIKEGMDNHTIISFDARLLLHGNKIKYIKYIARPVYNVSGRPVRRFGAVADITELKLQQVKLEEALLKLQNSEAQLLEAQKLAHLGNYSIDFKNGGKMEWSDEMYNIWEVDKNRPFDSFQDAWKLVHPDDLEELTRVLNNNSSESDRVQAEFRIVFPDNRIKYVQVITKLIFDDQGNLLKREGIEMDITERKLAQFELEKTLQKLERSNQELQQFAYIASHDLQEPLRMVSSYTSMLEKRYGNELDDKAKQYIHFAVDGSKRMTNLIKDLLAYSRVTTQANEFTDVDLNKIFSDVTRDLQMLIKEKEAKINSIKLPVIKADPVQMHQLLQNLIGNAIKFQSDSPPEVNIRVKGIKKGWLFSIKDNGIGIDPEFFDRIFQVFQRLHEQGKYPGTGIGLAVCKKIVERHGGKIWLESETGKGTTFYFIIPEHNVLTHQ